MVDILKKQTKCEVMQAIERDNDVDILWDDRLLIGHAEIDKQHKRLFAITARIFELGDAAADRVVCDILCELVDYATEHFGLEEEVLRIIKWLNSR